MNIETERDGIGDGASLAEGNAAGGMFTPDRLALIESEERFRSIFYGAPIGIALIDHDGRYLSVNPVRAAMLGYSENELVGRTYWDVTHPDDLEYDRRVNEEARAAGRNNYSLEKRFIRKDGSVQWTRITVSAVHIGSGQPAYYLSISEDITERKQAEEERQRLLKREHEARLRAERLAAQQEAIMRQAAEGIIITDAAGAITFANEAALKLHHWPASGPPSRTYHQAVSLLTLSGEEWPAESTPLVRAILHGQTVEATRWRLRFEERDVIVEGSAVPVEHAGKRVGAVLTVRDITDQYELQKQKDAFLSAAAHDLRTPLTAVKGRIQMLQRRVQRGYSFDPEALATELGRIDESTTRMTRLIRELLDIASIELGRPLQLSRRYVDIVALAHVVIEEQSPLAVKRTIRLLTETEAVIGNWDSDRLERVLGNLISNAVKYSPEGSEILVRIRESTGRVEIAVIDQGFGIPENDLPRVFERFHRAANVEDRVAGTGIGLTAVRQIVEQHGGAVHIESREGTGTTVTIILPVDDGKEQ